MMVRPSWRYHLSCINTSRSQMHPFHHIPSSHPLSPAEPSSIITNPHLKFFTHYRVFRNDPRYTPALAELLLDNLDRSSAPLVRLSRPPGLPSSPRVSSIPSMYGNFSGAKRSPPTLLNHDQLFTLTVVELDVSHLYSFHPTFRFR